MQHVLASNGGLLHHVKYSCPSLSLSLQVLNPVNNDYLEYADADYAALYVMEHILIMIDQNKIKIIIGRYAEGPIGYKAASMQRALVKRQKMGLEGGARL